jgi:hypothetical protein
MTRIPVVDALANELDAWSEQTDGSLTYEIWHPGSGEDEPIILIKGTAKPGQWHYEERD